MYNETARADRSSVEAGLREIYLMAGMVPPKAIVWVDSPLEGAYARVAIPKIFGRPSFTNKTIDPIFRRVEKKIRAQVPFMLGLTTLLHAKQVNTPARIRTGPTAVIKVMRALADVKVDARKSLAGNNDAALSSDRTRRQINGAVRAAIDELWRGRGVVGGESVGVPADLASFEQGLLSRIYALTRSDGASSGGRVEYSQVLQQVVSRVCDDLDCIFWMFGDFAILVDRPILVKRDAVGNLHCEDGPALEYGDGFSSYFWHGTSVPERLILGEPWSLDEIAHEPNVEVRRCAVERIGWENFVESPGISQIGATVEDPGNPGQVLSLYDVPTIFTSRVRVLICANATLDLGGQRHKFGIYVPGEIDDPVAAAAWTFGVSAKEYRDLQRAT